MPTNSTFSAEHPFASPRTGAKKSAGSLIRPANDQLRVQDVAVDRHRGFIQDGEQRVNEINQRPRDDGSDVPPPSHQHAAWTFYFVGPGGFTVEVMG